MRPKYRLAYFCAAVLALAACRDGGQTGSEIADSSEDVASTAPGTCPDGNLPVVIGTLHGGVSGELMAMPTDTVCSGMSRPAGKGLRLRFQTLSPGSDAKLTLILGIDALSKGDAGSGIRTTVTVIDEAAQRFYSTGEQFSCFSDISKHTATAEPNTTQLDGVAWCTTAIPELNGNNSIRMPELRFRGLVQWPKDPQ